MRFGLSDAQLETITAILAKYEQVSRGIIFGSRAMGNYKEASDIDLAIKGKDITFSTILNISGDFDDSDLPLFFDVVNYHTIDHPPFKRHIDAKGVTFYRRGWREVRLGDFCPFVYGKSLPDKNRDALGKIPVYGSGGVVGHHSVAHVKSSGLIIGRKGTVGAVYLSEKPFWPIDTVFYATKDSDWDLRFAYYLLTTLRLTEMNSDSAVPGLNRNSAHALKVQIAGSSLERKSVAKNLYEIDLLISKNNAINTSLESMADAIFKSWFVNFDPVQAKKLAIEAGLPAEQAAMAVISALCSPREFVENFAAMDQALSKKLAGMSSAERDELNHTAALFPSEFMESELGLIPRGWVVKSMSDTMEFLNGLALQNFPPANDGTDLPILKIAQLKQGSTNGGGLVSNKIAEKYVIDDGDVIFSWSANLMVKIWTGGTAAPNQQLFKVTSPRYEKWFQYFWCKHHLDEFIVIAKSKATTMGHIQRRHLVEAKVIVPDESLLSMANVFLTPLVEGIILYGIEVKKLAKLRDTLLPKLMNGELDVSEVSAQ